MLENVSHIQTLTRQSYQAHLCVVLAVCGQHNNSGIQGTERQRKKDDVAFSWILILWWLVRLLGKSYGCVILNISMTTRIIGMTRENMISFLHVSCLRSDSLLNCSSFSFMIWVSQVAAGCEDITLVSGEQMDRLSCWSLCCFFVVAEWGSILCCFYQCQIAARCPFGDGIPAGKDLVIKADRCSQSLEK